MMARLRCGTCRRPWTQGLNWNFNHLRLLVWIILANFLTILSTGRRQAPCASAPSSSTAGGSSGSSLTSSRLSQAGESVIWFWFENKWHWSPAIMFNLIYKWHLSPAIMFNIIFSSHDDTILIWDFLNLSPPERWPDHLKLIFFTSVKFLWIYQKIICQFHFKLLEHMDKISKC